MELITKKKRDLKYLIFEDYLYIDKLWKEEELYLFYPLRFKELLKKCLNVDSLHRPDSKSLYFALKEIQIEESTIFLQSLIRSKLCLIGN
jgi:hypothetical protein